MTPFRPSQDSRARTLDPSVQYDGGDGGLFSLQEVQRLMRIEFDRSKRYHYPLACFLIVVDRLERLQDLHGLEIKRAVHQALTELLRSEIRSSDLLACLLNERLLVMLPHATREGADALAQRILSGARRLAFESQGRSVRITLSIGGAHNQLVLEPQYETLLSVAEGGLDVAIASGGDRYVHTELYEHFEKKHQREERRRRTDGTPAAVPAPAEPPEPQPGRQIFALGAPPARPARPAPAPEPPQPVPELTPAERDAALAAQEREHRQEVENLERRISKLTAMLEKTESDLVRMAQLKAGDEGVASIYKSVQGLSQEESALELKKDLMQKIFEANMELKQAIARGST
jgi:diguanylate cyclase (GGDEF)-like protein